MWLRDIHACLKSNKKETISIVAIKLQVCEKEPFYWIDSVTGLVLGFTEPFPVQKIIIIGCRQHRRDGTTYIYNP